MDDKATPNSYLQITTETYGVVIEAIKAANQRSLDYAKSVWDIASRPYQSNSLDTAVRENFDRSNEIMSLTVGELQTRQQHLAEFAEKLVSQNAKLQESSVQAMRGVVNTGISNLNFVKDTAKQGLDDLNKRIDETQSRATASISQN